jgi:hypothetical protein
MSLRFFLTLDCDWAPDFAIAHARALIASRNAHATLFATHPSPALEAWKRTPGLEVGWHPNLLPGSSHGKTPAEAAAYLEGFAPGARGMRTHGLLQSTGLLAALAAAAPSLRYDASLYVPGQASLRGFDFPLPGGKSLRRYPFAWEDDLHLAAAGPLAPPLAGLPSEGLCILNFHPIHVYLNTSDMRDYERVKALGPLASLAPSQVDPHRRIGPGIGSLFEWALGHCDFPLNLGEWLESEAALSPG